MILSVSMLPPIAVSLYYKDGTILSFVLGFVSTFFAGLILWFPVRNYHREMRLRDGFIVVAMFWLVLGVCGAIPFVLASNPNLSITNAIFESISGLTTTGATVITGLDDLPRSILYYRQQLQWLGGLGIIILALAILPMLGIGGMQLYRAETPGPIKDTRLTPRITETVKALWYIYLGLTITCCLAYWAGGMSLFDAIGHSFSTVAIGGFSTHDQSIGYFKSPLIESIAVVFMVLSGANFSLHFLAWRKLSIKPYYHDPEFITYLKVLAGSAFITTIVLYATNRFDAWGAIQNGIFQAVSIGTTTGFTNAHYQTWQGFLPTMLLMTSFIGACAGSTGGGMKVIRILLLVKQGMREVFRLIHPSAQVPVKIGDKMLGERVVDSVWGFFSLYMGSFLIMSILLSASGLDIESSFSAVAACMNNLGPGLGSVSTNYAGINDMAKWILCFAMLLGRVEIFTLLVLLTPAFWRK